MWSTAVAIFAVGGMSGALVGPVIANSLGRLVAAFYVYTVSCFISMKHCTLDCTFITRGNQMIVSLSL